MSRRWMRCVVAVAGTLALTASAAGIARADPLQYLVNVGGSDAAARGTTAGVAMVDRVTGIYSDNGANAHLRFGSASLVKLFIADSVLHRARLGQLHLTAADMSSLTVMLRSSDDAAANSFWSRFGSSAIVTDVMHRYHLTETAPPVNARYWGLTQITAHDLVALYRGMLNGAGGLAPADRDFITTQLRSSTSHGTDGYYQWFGLHDALTKEPVLGIKQGWMCCFSDGHIWRHSTGIVGPDARYIVVVLTRDPGSAGSAHTVTSVTHAVQRSPAGLVPRVNGAIGDHWYAIGGPSSRLGLPTGTEASAVGGRYSLFQRGAIYWSPASGAYLVAGGIGGTGRPSAPRPAGWAIRPRTNWRPPVACTSASSTASSTRRPPSARISWQGGSSMPGTRRATRAATSDTRSRTRPLFPGARTAASSTASSTGRQPRGPTGSTGRSSAPGPPTATRRERSAFRPPTPMRWPAAAGWTSRTAASR